MEKRDLNVISWCLFINTAFDAWSRLPEYLFGLKCNQRAARVWFPGWQLRLYIDASVTENSSVYNYVSDIARYGEPQIELIPCREGCNPMIERHRPFADQRVNVCLVRDLDSILSRTDAEIVQHWMNDTNYDVLRYREYQQSRNLAMGGGIAIKCHTLPLDLKIPTDKYWQRGHDENVLATLLTIHTDHQRHYVLATRMADNGTYFLLDHNREDVLCCRPDECHILWPMPFFYCENGFLHQCAGNEWLECASLEKMVEYLQTFSIRREHTGSHHKHHHAILCRDEKGRILEWIR